MHSTQQCTAASQQGHTKHCKQSHPLTHIPLPCPLSLAILPHTDAEEAEKHMGEVAKAVAKEAEEKARAKVHDELEEERAAAERLKRYNSVMKKLMQEELKVEMQEERLDYQEALQAEMAQARASLNPPPQKERRFSAPLGRLLSPRKSKSFSKSSTTPSNSPAAAAAAAATATGGGGAVDIMARSNSEESPSSPLQANVKTRSGSFSIGFRSPLRSRAASHLKVITPPRKVESKGTPPTKESLKETQGYGSPEKGPYPIGTYGGGGTPEGSPSSAPSLGSQPSHEIALGR